MATQGNILNRLTPLGNYSHLAVPIAVVAILMVMILPMPPLILDFFLSIDIVLSVVILLVAIYTLRPVNFSIFPSLLLLVTLYRLALNVAATRLILLNGGDGVGAAGHVIQAFGQFVVGGNYVVGFVIFVVLMLIQFVVISHGAVRVSEVTARFTLDALPGKQMAIDADLNAGIIDESEARSRRKIIGQEADFHGAMDGAIRFTQRDSVIAMLILVINIVAGFIIGVFQYNMQLTNALQTYTVLTIGDGLVSAIPSLLISVAGGIITTRAASESTMGEDVAAQLFINPRPLAIGAVVLGLLGLMPGFPTVTFMLMGGAIGVIAFISHKKAQDTAAKKALAEAKPPDAPVEERIESLLKVDVLALEVGYGLISLVNSGRSDNLLSRIKSVRRQIAMDLGIIVPPVHITDNLRLGPREYSIKLKGVEIARGELMIDRHLAINPGSATVEIDGIATKEPSFGLPARWIRDEQKEQAQFSGYTVVDPTTVVITHLSELIKRHAYELLGRQETKQLLDVVSETHPKVIEELTPKVLSLGEVQRVLQGLLREQVAIRDLITVLESLADIGAQTHDLQILTEFARQSLARSICQQLANDRNELQVLTLAPEIERQFNQAVTKTPQGTVLALDPNIARDVLQKLNQAAAIAPNGGNPVLLVSSAIRFQVKKLTERFIPNLAVISHNEVTPGFEVTSVGTIQ
ncbi:MAG TPA: flagellar biosynthesis protein FlhA [Blastocatellia bacterium]|nr:flagellar biosynthesis protein FlhA [Blastocatellia bacterium]